MGHGSCGLWVNCVMGHMGHGSRKMTHFHLCCQEEKKTKDLHRCSTLNIDKSLREMAELLEDERLIGILAEGNAIALNILCHRHCYTTY